MPLTKLKAISQDTWLHSGGGPSRDGVCYYMCNFIESDKGPWNNPGSFANAVTAAQNFAQGTAMMNYAKAQNLRSAPQQFYNPVAGTLDNNRIYRAELTLNKQGKFFGHHEIVIVTGNNNDIIYFEPNFGFFQASDSGLNNRQALESYIAQQYKDSGLQVSGFGYYNVRSNSAALPKGFKC